MDRQVAIAAPDAVALRELEREILLHINERLLREGVITQKMRGKAMEMILKA